MASASRKYGLNEQIYDDLKGIILDSTIQKLVGGLEHEFYFSIYWEFHHPN